MIKFLSPIFLMCYMMAVAQGHPHVDFTHGHIAVEVFPESGKISGEVNYRFALSKRADSLLVSGRDLTIRSVSLKGRALDFRVAGNTIVIIHDFKAGKYKDLVISYEATPVKAVYFPGWTTSSPSGDPLWTTEEGGRQVWTQGQGKYSSSWVPSFDDMNEKVIYSIDLIFPEGYRVLANGSFKGKASLGERTKWRYALEHPVSSYLLAFVAGRYEVRKIRSGSGIPMELYFYPGDSAKVTSTYRHSKEIFDYLEKEIGVAYPWSVYRQVPVRDFLYAGMENVSLTIFSDSYITDSIGFSDRNYVNVNAHELAHQWFGNLITEKSGKHHWLHEGFATYYALLAEKELFGEDHYYWKLYNTALQLSALSSEGNGESLLDAGAGSLTFYEKGAWALHILRELVGDKAFKAGVKSMLEEYAFKNVTTDVFLGLLGQYTKADLDEFRKTWLEAEEFPDVLARESLEKNEFIKRYKHIQNENASAVVVYNEYLNALRSEAYFPVKQLIINKSGSWPRNLRDSLWLKALTSEDLRIRQGVAVAADSIGPEFKDHFETLLEDQSYRTIQEALMKLWIEFPEKRKEYLHKTAHNRGFEDRSLRVLWLGLTLFTSEMEADAQHHFEELQSYTGPAWQFETRQQAFNMLFEIGGFTKRSLLNLIQGLDHAAWQYSRYCRNMLDRLLMKPEMRLQVRVLLPELDPVHQEMVRQRLESTNNGTN